MKLTFVIIASFSELLPCRKLPLLVLSCTTPGNILGGGGIPSIQDVPFACDGDMIIDDDLTGLLCSRPVRWRSRLLTSALEYDADIRVAREGHV